MSHFHSLCWGIRIEMWRVGKRNRFILGMGTGEKYLGELQYVSFEPSDHITTQLNDEHVVKPVSTFSVPHSNQQLPPCQGAWAEASPDLHRTATGSSKTHKPDPKFRLHETRKRGWK